MAAWDKLNARYGRGTVQLASAGVRYSNVTGEMRQKRRTPNYTNVWPRCQFGPDGLALHRRNRRFLHVPADPA